MGCDLFVKAQSLQEQEFQSTQPEWAATLKLLIQSMQYVNFNPRSPSGLRQGSLNLRSFQQQFQSTQPEWAATLMCKITELELKFQSTQPEWAATISLTISSYLCPHFNPRSPSGLRHLVYNSKQTFDVISIHAARVGCDRM